MIEVSFPRLLSALVLGTLIFGVLPKAEGADQVCTDVSEVTVSAEHIVEQRDGSFLVINPRYKLLDTLSYFYGYRYVGRDYIDGVCRLLGFQNSVDQAYTQDLKHDSDIQVVTVNAQGRLRSKYVMQGKESTRVIERLTCI